MDGERGVKTLLKRDRESIKNVLKRDGESNKHRESQKKKEREQYLKAA
jgi:hypothetical protein